jgi:tetratricopeptide (TPR) repeat protein
VDRLPVWEKQLIETKRDEPWKNNPRTINMKLPFFNQRALVLLLILVIAGFLSLTLDTSVSAQDKLPKQNGHINDFGEVLDAATKGRLEMVLDNLKERSGIDFVVVTVKSAGSEDLYDYSLRIANDWNLGAPAGANRSVLLVIAADSKKFFTQATRLARRVLPDGLIGNMGLRLQSQIETAGYSAALVTGIKTFADGAGELHNFTFADLEQRPAENLVAEQQRPRSVASPAAQPTESPVAQPLPTPVAQPAETPVAQPTETRVAQPTEMPTPERRPNATPTIEATPPLATPEASASAQPTATPATATATPTPIASPEPTESPLAQASPSVAAPTPAEVAANPTRPARPPVTDRKPSTAAPANPEDEKEEVEVTLAQPPDRRIQTLKAFIAAHPQSVAVPRAHELIVVAHAMLGDQRLQAGNIEGSLDQFRLAISDAPADMPDRLFSEVIARIPANLFFRGQQAAAMEFAHQAEALAGKNPNRLAAVAGFYLAIEDTKEAAHWAELATQAGPDSAAAHQALGEARHIALRLDDAENEFARALELDPKSTGARLALADLKRGAGKFEAALTLYRDQLKADPKSNAARAGIVVSLLELGRKSEADEELNKSLSDKELARNLPLLVGAAYWFLAHDDATRGLDLAQKAVALEPRYVWAQIVLARALIAGNRPQDGERSLRFVRQFGRFPTVDYELANLLAALGLFDDAAVELAHSFSVKGGQIETMLAGRQAARAGSFTELIAPERRAVIFQSKAADTEANAKMLKALLALNTALNQPEGSMPSESELAAIAKDFTSGNDSMRTFRQIYVAEEFLQKGVALSSVIDLMDQATGGVEAALSVPNATLAVQPDEYSDVRARALTQGGTPKIPEAPRSALSGLLRARIEDLAGQALFKMDKASDAVARLRRAVNAAPEGTPLWRAAMWHLGGALEASGKNDQALPYYIKAYVAGPPDAARRSVIENVYKKVNGSLDGLDEKIGPGAAATPTPKP